MCMYVGGKRVVGGVRVILCVVSAVVCLAMVLAGCGNSDPVGITGKGGNVILGDGEAWVLSEKQCIQSGVCIDVGYIFNSNGNLTEVDYLDDVQLFGRPVGWYGVVTGTWSASGDKLTISYTLPGYESMSGAIVYSVEGDILTFHQARNMSGDMVTMTLTKRSGIHATMLEKKRENIVFPKILLGE